MDEIYYTKKPMTTKTMLPFGLKQYRVWEPETHWNIVINAKSEQQAKDKAWAQFWAKLPFSHCNKESFQVREVQWSLID